MKKITALFFSAMLMLPPPAFVSASEVLFLDDQVGSEEVYQPIPEFSESWIRVWQENDGILTKSDILDYVDYAGDKNELDITIESTIVYIIQGEETFYYHDLNRVLEKTNFDNLVSFDEEYAIRLGYVAAEGSTPFINQINLTHGGGTYYRVIASNQHGSAESYIQVESRWTPEPPIDPPTEPEPEPPVIDPEPEPPVEPEPPMIIDPEPEPGPPIVVEPEKLPNLKFNNQRNNFSVKPNSTISMKELHELVEFDGDKKDLKFSIKSNMVYVPKDNKNYHFDLDELLKTSRVDDIAVYTEKDAISKGLTPDSENGLVSSINRSLPGKYTVEVSYDFGEENGRFIQVDAEILVTGQTETNPDDTNKPDDSKNDDDSDGNPNDDPKKDDNNKSGDGSNNGSNKRDKNRQTRNSSKQSKLPATGSQHSATISVIGLGIFVTGAYILSKKKKLKR
ncbi:hypothetical protein IGI82_001961 [Enterococcus sp. AZ067]|uniref:LPXTG cell wall anchor domain-containing protein n=1 Tax=Enterococcus sp. AZ067 TaxID=2774674 RepID=UPI003F25EC42